MRAVVTFALVALLGTSAAQAQTANQSTTNDQIARGEYLVHAGDCIVCHTREGGPAFAGGRPLKTPFGVIYSANITPDAKNGIGAWTDEQFYRALHEGRAADGTHLYPAFPYTEFTKVSRADTDAIRAYLATLPAVDYAPPPNTLPFPFSWRFLMTFWNALFFRKGEFEPDASQTAEWNRGAYLIEGLGHCQACHTPRNFAGAEKHSQAFAGYRLPDLAGDKVVDWYAPSLQQTMRTGLADWDVDEIARFLQTGRTERHGAAAGPMAAVIQYSTQYLSDADIHAMAVYLKSFAPTSDTATNAAPAGETMSRGEAIYLDNCATCHKATGEGQAAVFPPMKGSAIVQSADPATMVQLILRGFEEPPTDGRSDFSMPAYGAKLSDNDIAALTTYLRNSWGNSCSLVSADQIHDLR